MFKVENGKIYLTRGDSARLQVDIADETGESYAIQPGDTLRLTVKRHATDKAPLITKTVTGGNVFTFVPTDTAPLPFAAYLYDVELTTAANEVYTVITPQEFKIGEEVTW